MIAWLPFIFRWGKLIAVAAALGSIALYAQQAERNRALVKVLETENAQYRVVAQRQDEQIRSLHEQIKRNNDLTMERLAKERLRLLEVSAEVDRVKGQRDTITAELAKARQDWLEAIANDETIPEFISMPVPGAVWRRLRDAAG